MPDARQEARKARQSTRSRADFPHFIAIATRWMDNDVYGHVNNVTYYSYFDTAVNEHLIRFGGLDFYNDSAVGLVAETGCTFRKSLSFPETIDAGLAVTKLGKSSVVYEIGLFRHDDDEPAALGRFVHVWVDRVSQRPVAIPEQIRAALEPLVVARVASPP
ncbi:MAG TPA: thioesterase family protein [Casimicrobiaceae bacterium]|nr:thioesterase family protein [Casimicrobiaceae bacterium]